MLLLLVKLVKCVICIKRVTESLRVATISELSRYILDMFRLTRRDM